MAFDNGQSHLAAELRKSVSVSGGSSETTLHTIELMPVGDGLKKRSVYALKRRLL